MQTKQMQQMLPPLSHHLQQQQQPPHRPVEFRVIELRHMHLGKFIGLTCLGNATMQALTYPLALARTRLTVQVGCSEYRGLVHCLHSVLAREGLRGLYAGVWTRGAHVANAALVGLTYESVRAAFEPLPKPARGAIAGACTAMMSQVVLVPADVVTQHLMLVSMARLSPVSSVSAAGWMGQASAVIRWVRQQHGMAGFYKGGFLSVVHFLPNSAIMWSAYSVYCDYLGRLEWPSRLAVQLVSAPLAGATAGLVMNPVDVIRLRVMTQAEKGSGAREALRRLWAEEGLAWLAKGLTARLAQSAVFSFLFVLYYEPAKRLSLKPEFRDTLTW